jgi:hypothetical protein
VGPRGLRIDGRDTRLLEKRVVAADPRDAAPGAAAAQHVHLGELHRRMEMTS